MVYNQETADSLWSEVTDLEDVDTLTSDVTKDLILVVKVPAKHLR